MKQTTTLIKALAVVALLAAPSLFAATYYWDNNGATAGFGTAGGTWAAPTTGSSSQGWSTDSTGATLPGNVTTATTDSLYFGYLTTGLAAGTVTVSGSVSAGNITFDSGSGAIVLSGGTAIGLASPSTITLNNAADTISTPITSGALTLAGTGTLTLSGANTYSGATTINAGTVSLANATGAGTSAMTVNSSGKLAVNASTSGDMTYANSVAGAGNVQFLYVSSGGHDIYLNNLGSFTGTIELSLASGSASTGGKARLYGATLSGTSSLIIDSGTQLYMGGGNVTLAGIQVQGTGNTENRGAIRAQSGTLAGPISLMGDTTIGSEGGTISGNISSGASGTQTLTLGTANSTGNLTLSGNLGGGTGTMLLTKTQAGTTTLSGVNTYTGATTISAGTLTIGGSGSLGSGSYSAGITDNGALNYSSSAAQTLSGVISGTGSVTDSGAGTLTLSGANTYTGATAVNAGTLNYNGSLSSGGQLTVNGSGVDSVVNFGSGAGAITFNSANILDGDNATAAGAIFQSGGTIAGVNQLKLNDVTGGYGYYNLSGGALTIAELDGGGIDGAGTGVFDITGGTMTDTTWFILARAAGNYPVVFNMTGGTFNFTGTSASRFLMNWNNNAGESAVINVANANFNALNATAGILNMMSAGSAGELGVVNLLSSGFMQVQGITAGNTTGTSHFNFNGGTLKASTANATFLNSFTLANVYSGGGTIDNNGIAITIPEALSAPAGSGINSAVTFTGGSGYVGAPAVTFSGGGGTGATAYATISGGAVTGIVITSPGINYASAPTITLTGGGYATAATATAPTPTANTSGGMTFQGSGTTTLSGANTYSGGTTVSAGVLDAQNNNSLGSGSASVSANAALQVDGNGLSLGNALTLNGTGVSTGGALRNLANNNTYSGAISLGSDSRINSDGGTLTLNSGTAVTSGYNLTFGGAGNVSMSTPIQTGAKTVRKDGGGTLTVSGASTYSGGTTLSAGQITLGASSTGSGNSVTSGPLGTGTLTLSGGTLQLNAQTLGNNLSATASTTTIVDNSGNNGTLNGNVIGSGTITIQNSSGNNLSDFINGDWSGFTGTFNYTTSGSVVNIFGNTVNLSGAAVNVAGNNASSTFRIGGTVKLGSLAGSSGYLDSSGGTFEIGNLGASTTYGGVILGSGAVRKVGTGALTLSGVNTYSGATAINAGELVGQTGGSCSSSAVTVAAGATNGVQLAAANGHWTCASVAYSAGGTNYADFNFNSLAPSTATAPLKITGNLATNGIEQVIVRNGSFTANTAYPLMTWGGTGPGNLATFAKPVGAVGTLQLSGNTLSLEYGIYVPNVTFTNTPGIARIITTSDLIAAGLASSQGSPNYTITVGTPVNGGAAFINSSGTMMKYTNSPSFPGNSDSFTYTVSDGTSSATATVNLMFAPAVGPQLTAVADVNNHPVISFHAIPGDSYHIQRATTLSPADWTSVQAVTCDSNGYATWTDTSVNTTQSSAFYRLVYP